MIGRIVKSFQAAGRGLKYAFINEQNFRLQFVIGLLALALAAYFPRRQWEKVLVLFLVALVLAMELLNTALERFADLLKPRLNTYVLLIKDIMAGAVLLLSLAAGLIGLIIFYPYFISLVK